MIFAFVAVVLAGLMSAIEAPTNATLTKSSGSALWAGLAAGVTGTIGVLLAIAVLRPKLPVDWWSSPPAYVWLAGIYGSLIVVLTGWATPKLGAATALVVIIAGQVVLGVALDHFGLLGLEQHTASGLRIAGAAVVIGGALMVALG